MKAKIGKRLLETLQPGSYEVWDDELPGFVLRIRKGGTQTYYCVYRTPSGRRTRIAIGTTAVFTPAQARSRAKEVLADIANGIDPMAVKRLSRTHSFERAYPTRRSSYRGTIENALWTKSGMRFIQVKSNAGEPLNWLFLPGGPGLGSEYLSEFTRHLSLPGTLWHIDFPGDGSNTFTVEDNLFHTWTEALIEAASTLTNTILVAHSTGGMLALSVPALEKYLVGLVLMSSAPDSSWQNQFSLKISKNIQTDVQHLQNKYKNKPSNSLLKAITIHSIPLLFTQTGLKKDLSWFRKLPYNHSSHRWCEENFDHSYSAKWTPNKIPTLILSGDQDQLTPLKLFMDRPELKRDNIEKIEIKNSGHFPWVDNLNDTCLALSKFSKHFDPEYSH